MGSHERSRLVELLLEEDLEAVTLGLEQGLYCWDEIDLPHDSDGCTPLISACRMGLTMVMRFLLERGADATLCNHSNQTALHVSQPALEGELLSALIRDLPHQMQLSDTAWRGDPCSLQDLMAQTDMLDFNKQNRDGLTPLMLAVRDIDLFEGLELPWKYHPVLVVKELMSLSVDTKMIDQRGHSALWYISQIMSSKKEELLRMVDSASQTDRDIREYSCPSRHKSSLWGSRKSWDHTRLFHPSLKMTSSVPVFPTPHCNQLSKLTSTLMEPALDASLLLQARANIHNRLRCPDTEDEFITQKMSLPTMLRTPKHLAPLNSRFRNVSATTSIEHPPPIKPPSTFPFASEGRGNVERISRLSFRRSRSTRAGSEESHSCSSSSSQEEEENVPQETYTIIRELELVSHLDFQDLNSSEINTIRNKDIIISDDRKDNTLIESIIDRQVDADVRNVSKTSANSEELQKKSENIDSYRNEPSSTSTRARDNGSCVNSDEKHLREFVVDQILHEKSKPSKAIKRNDKKCKASFHTNQSFNILAHRNQATDKTTSIRINSPIHSKVKLRENKPSCVVIAADNPNKSCLPRMTPTGCKKNTDEVTTTKRVSETCQDTRLSCDDKKASFYGQKQFHRNLRSAGPSKKPVLGATLRAKSAVDHVTYNDMFLKISQDDEGPTIYEMFATPVYENLRVDNSADKTKPGHTSLQVKRQINGKQRGQKTTDVNRRNLKESQSRRYSPAKCRQHKRRDSVPKRIKKHLPFSENKRHNVTSDCEEEQESSNIPNTEDDGKDVPSWVIKRQKSPILSVIEEVLSNTFSKPNTPQQNSSVTRSEAHLIHFTTDQEPQTPNNLVTTGEPETSCMSRLPAQPLVNTWTSDRTVSPVHVYQKFLEEVGDGPLTEDLLRSLAKGLISLEEREAETLESEKYDGKEFSNGLPAKFKKLLNEDISSGELKYAQRSSSDDAAVTWTKGEVLGKGAYGTVYCGLTSQGQLIAVKQVVLDASTSEIAEKEYDRLEREVDLLKNLQHTNIVGFLGTGLLENIVCIFMEYVPGGSIASILGRFGPLPEKVFALYTRQILEGVAHLHANRVIHRDLKGNNIMLMPTGIVKLIDFGCARRLNCLTLSGSKGDLLKSVHGTPYWMAPEVINETGHGRKSDIWSIGCTIFEMATGKPPLAHMAKMAALFYIGARKGLMPSLPNAFSTNARDFVEACLTRQAFIQIF
ncbi:Mitogen-activated protein kinase kinase kinase 19 [Triplophysa tibetana]|uniref:Mitogen-activated protein kinase kinase kinase 19 n=1 Tax=Triplophysa tibetana TaxID=1572043 RepID=A0A5A9NZZ4_9TELE|nr:Mitogen-activated protein kinase kinase kinase 19 [Triplophysa tibetana]